MHSVRVTDASPHMRPVGRLSPGTVVTPVPPDGPCSLGYALLDPVGLDRRVLVKFLLHHALFAKVRSDVHLVAGLGPVLSTELDGVDS